MLRAYCTICSDLYETSSNISVTTCGHVFHEHCLQRWTNQSKTCPQCRADCCQRNIIRRIYFEISDDSPEDVDPSSLKNELDRVKAQLSQQKKEKSDLKKEKERLYDQISSLESKIGDLMDRANKAESTNSVLRKQLKILSLKQDDAERARKEARDLRIKLKRLERFEAVMTENTREVEEMLQNYGSGQHALKDLATYVVSLKKEFDNTKQGKHKLRDELEEVSRTIQVKNKKLMEKTKECNALQKQLKLVEDDLQHVEDEKKSLSKKVEVLQRAVDSPSGAEGAITRLVNESPAPQIYKDKPTLSSPEGGGFDLSPGFPDTPEVISESPAAKIKKVCKEFDIPYVKTTALAEKNKKTKAIRQSEEDYLSYLYANSDLFKKRRLGETNVNASIRTGYNGLGGHHTVIEASPRDYFLPPPKRIVKPAKRRRVTKPDSSLRTLNEFLKK
ncbi:E3 ubiquitin-protein ligase TRAIP-like [Ptychodera flava]|uniref:E3 ubiquitin-protein ligase TRAIP-like n=1 Tax=Ptychodera flava TaxID=63121 RepID=UPI00396A086E